MLENIKNLEGVTLLSKEEQKSVNGGLKVRNVQCTGNIIEYNGGAYAFECTWDSRPSWIGIGFGSWEPQKGPCPVGFQGC
ncbi:MAG: hypothetical protein CFE23_15205 [Flavobacterium sp. BFFFF1]|uniref:hypothetical protein n=1 Tax=Flavobacterium sp. BFFFF1 TaxID=2015557 RepID=UPI000BC3DC26|nr:hypothetical protein [Flavobacterium sp. BFFFF1]OYU79183.1 MAG: hypothetical protein CFE23_15205 [Flavobacterium sp. BFFFF1]